MASSYLHVLQIYKICRHGPLKAWRTAEYSRAERVQNAVCSAVLYCTLLCTRGIVSYCTYHVQQVILTVHLVLITIPTCLLPETPIP